MKKFFSLLSAAGIAVIATGCASTHVSKTSATLNVEMKKVIATPDVVGGEKVSGEATTLTVLGILKFGSTKFADGIVMQSSGGLFGDKFGAVKDAVSYDACKKNSADILLVPNYKFETKDYFIWNITHCKVTGFKGVVKKISKIEVLEPKDCTKCSVK